MQRGSPRFPPMDTVVDFGITSPPKPPKRPPLCLPISRYWLIGGLFALIIFTTIFFRTTPEEPFKDQPGGGRFFMYQGNYGKYNVSSVEYEFAIISDMDKKSKMDSGKEWKGILKYGKLKRGSHGDYQVFWMEEDVIISAYNEGGRGMELSELVYFDGKLLTCDDRTGIIFEILTTENKLIVVPLYVVTVGDGKTDKGFKCEWMTVVNDKLYVGSIGKEFTDEHGEIKNYGAQWIKIIDRNGKIEHINWRENYEALRKKSETVFPAYLWHEAIIWNPIQREWIVFPRRFSIEPYDEKLDEKKGTNIFFIANEDFSRIEEKTVGLFDSLKGTSSFKLLPFREGEVAQLKTIESGDKIESYLTVVNIYTGQVLMADTFIGDVKFEGLEIL